MLRGSEETVHTVRQSRELFIGQGALDEGGGTHIPPVATRGSGTCTQPHFPPNIFLFPPLDGVFSLELSHRHLRDVEN